MRFYSFTNYYLSSIQIGIQTAHAMAEMQNKYEELNYHSGMHVVTDWRKNHKTMVLLNGGNSAELQKLYTLLTDERNPNLPVSKFHEDADSLSGALTCVAIILPKWIYTADKVFPDRKYPAWDNELPPEERKHRWFIANENTMIEGWEAEVLDVIKSLPLAK